MKINEESKSSRTIEHIEKLTDESLCLDLEESKKILNEIGVDHQEEVKRGINFINILQGKIKLQNAKIRFFS